MTGDRPAGSDAAGKTLSHVLGEVSWLISQSPLGRNLFVADLEWFVMPPLLLEQFRLYPMADGRPAGLLLWARITEETEQRLIAGNPRLAPHEWNAGDRLWLIELIAPFGGEEEMLEDAKRTIFAGQSFRYQVAGPDGPEVRIVEPVAA
jgi:cytolysin-activating lysine-acyltransferase